MAVDVEELVSIAFDDGGRYEDPSGIVCEIAALEVGRLDLPTGRVGIADPAFDNEKLSDSALMCADLGPGSHAFEAAVFRPYAPDGRRLRSQIAAVRIGRPGSGVWSPAWEREGEPLGVPVDSGSIAVFDMAGRSRLPLPVDGEVDGTDWTETVIDRGFYIMDSVPNFGSIIVYQCSMGDGSYIPWIQRGRDGNVSCIMVDMGVVE